MSGSTNRRFVRSAWTLLAFQLVAAGGATGIAIWAATKVQALVDQRDLLQARVARLESEQSHRAVAPADDVPEPEIVPTAPLPVTVAPGPVRNPLPRAPHGAGGSGVTVHEGAPPPAVIETPPPRPPETTYVPSQPPVRTPPREPPVRTPPLREPPSTYVPPRQPPVLVRPAFPTRPVPAPQQPGISVRPTRPNNGAPLAQKPGTATRPNRPVGITIIRPAVTQPQAGTIVARPVDPRRVRRPRPTDTGTQNPPK
jgi:hypothetical protein